MPEPTDAQILATRAQFTREGLPEDKADALTASEMDLAPGRLESAVAAREAMQNAPEVA